jgi:2'-5' RNA ligase
MGEMIADSGLVVPFPEVEHAVAAYRLKHDPRAAIGVAAHVTVHFPWIPAGRVDAGALAKVRELAETMAPFTVTFAELRWFGEEVLWLAPTPEQPLRELSDRSAALWPEAPRYGGEFDDVVPHLTIGEVRDGGDRAALRQVAADLAVRLPLPAQAAEIWWYALDRSGQWVRRAAFKLGG